MVLCHGSEKEMYPPIWMRKKIPTCSNAALLQIKTNVGQFILSVTTYCEIFSQQFCYAKSFKYVTSCIFLWNYLTSVFQNFVSLWFDEVFSTYFVALHLWVTMRFNNLSSLFFMGLMSFLVFHCFALGVKMS